MTFTAARGFLMILLSVGFGGGLEERLLAVEPATSSAPAPGPATSQPVGADETLEQCLGLAQKGDPAAQYRLAERLYAGKGVEIDVGQALDWYKKSGEAGYVQAQEKLGNLCGGVDAKADLKKAIEQHIYWFRKAAEQGSIGGINHMIEAYEKGEGGVVPKDPQMVANWMGQRLIAYKKAAEAGNAHALYQIGEAYRLGEGTPVDFNDAIAWYEKAAEKGVGDALATLGQMYAAGQGGPKDDAAATKYYAKAVENGNPRGMWLLAEAYASGIGIPKNFNEADVHNEVEALYKWAFKGLEAGRRMSSPAATAEAYYMLGRLYLEGHGTRRDLTKAREWVEKASLWGSAPARETLKKLKAQETQPAQP